MAQKDQDQQLHQPHLATALTRPPLFLSLLLLYSHTRSTLLLPLSSLLCIRPMSMPQPLLPPSLQARLSTHRASPKFCTRTHACKELRHRARLMQSSSLLLLRSWRMLLQLWCRASPSMHLLLLLLQPILSNGRQCCGGGGGTLRSNKSS
jgi:hypothetical protein